MGQRIGRRTVVRATGGALLAGAALGSTGVGAVRAAQTEPSLVGTWVITSTRAGSVPNGILVTVLPQGGFLRTGNAHPTESPAMGVWQQGEDGVYEVTYLALQFDTTGAFIGHRKTWLRVPLDPSGDSFSGQFRCDHGRPEWDCQRPHGGRNSRHAHGGGAVRERLNPGQ